jgi:hypothetical protein
MCTTDDRDPRMLNICLFVNFESYHDHMPQELQFEHRVPQERKIVQKRLMLHTCLRVARKEEGCVLIFPSSMRLPAYLCGNVDGTARRGYYESPDCTLD